MKDTKHHTKASGVDTTESSVETKDRELFNQIAEHYCRKDILTVSRIARRQRLRKTFSVLPEIPDAHILDVGCGCGFSASYLKGSYSRYVGVDYAENLIRFARKHNGSDKADFYLKKIDEFFPDQEFDVIFMIGVLHHFDDLKKNFEHICRLLKPGGWILANEPQSSNVFIKLARKIRAKIDSSYSSDQVSLSVKDLHNLYENSGLTDIRIIPQGILSTPFAEVSVKAQLLFVPVVYLSVLFDRVAESIFGRLLTPFSWNLVAAGRKSDTIEI